MEMNILISIYLHGIEEWDAKWTTSEREPDDFTHRWDM